MTVVLTAQNVSGRVTGRSYHVRPIRRRGRLALEILAGKADIIVFEGLTGPVLCLERGAVLGRRDARLLAAHVVEATAAEAATLRADGFALPGARR